MEKLTVKGYEIEIYKGYHGDELFISKNGETVYSARVHKGDAMNRVKQVIG